MTRAHIAIGSNIQPEENIEEALKRLAQHVQIAAISTFYITPALHRPEQNDYYNGAAAIETKIPPRTLKFRTLRGIEAALGRVRTPDKYAARTIDLDLALYGEITLDEDGLILPDPDLATRIFLAVPVLELDPGLIVPGTQTRLDTLVNKNEAGALRPAREFTRRLRERLMQ